MNDGKIKIVFFGTPEFAGNTLRKLAKAEFCEVVGVVTVPDKPVGRKQILTPPPVKVVADENNIQVLQLENLRKDPEIINKLRGFKADLFVVIAYGKIIPKAILDIPKYGTLNIHYSLLPKYRGAAPVQYVLLNGEKETGVSIMLLDEEMDHGPIIRNKKLEIGNEDTSEVLFERLTKIGDELLLETITKYVAGEIEPVEQNHKEATYTKLISREDGLVDWTRSAQEIFDQWRAFQPWPGIYTESRIRNKKLRIKLLKIGIFDQSSESPRSFGRSGDSDKVVGVGEFFVEDGRLLVGCGSGTYLEVLELQVEGKKVMGAEIFVNGYMK